MIMVEEGFLTHEQLDAAIVAQHRTSKPLGQVLVELGLVSAGAVANALAEQHGGLLKTEFGLSAGNYPPAPEPAYAPAPEPELTPTPEPPMPQLRVVGDAEKDSERRRLVGELRGAAPAVRDVEPRVHRCSLLTATEDSR